MNDVADKSIPEEDFGLAFHAWVDERAAEMGRPPTINEIGAVMANCVSKLRGVLYLEEILDRLGHLVMTTEHFIRQHPDGQILAEMWREDGEEGMARYMEANTVKAPDDPGELLNGPPFTDLKD